MTDVLCETDHAVPLVHLSVTSLSGAAMDPPGKEGLTRLLVRLMRRATRGLTTDHIDELLDTLGSSLGADVSSSTCGLGGTCLTRNFDSFAELLGDMLTHPDLPEPELERLKRETQAEIIESLDDDQTLARSWFRRTLFCDHPYGRSVVGTPTSVGAIQVGDVRSHVGTCFTGGNLVFGFSGDLELTQGQELAERIRARLPTGAPWQDPVPPPQGPRGRHLLVVDKPERTQTQILIGGLGTHPHDADHTALVVANTAFGGKFSSRLMQEVRSQRGWSYGAYSHLPYGRQRQAFSMWTFPAATDAAACLKLELELLETWVAHGITLEELDASKRTLVNSHVFNVDTAAKRLALQLDEHLYLLPADYYESYCERIAAVSLEQANAALHARLSPQHLVIVVVGTATHLGSQLRDAVPNLADFTVVPYDWL